MSGAAKRLVVFLFSFFSAVSEGTRTKLLTTHRYIRGLALFIFLRPAYEQLDRMEDHILWASEDVVEKCRQTYMTECNMSAIAVSILFYWNLLRFLCSQVIYLIGHDYCSSCSHLACITKS